MVLSARNIPSEILYTPYTVRGIFLLPFVPFMIMDMFVIPESKNGYSTVAKVRSVGEARRIAYATITGEDPSWSLPKVFGPPGELTVYISETPWWDDITGEIVRYMPKYGCIVDIDRDMTAVKGGPIDVIYKLTADGKRAGVLDYR